jgi:hypothetical protein
MRPWLGGLGIGALAVITVRSASAVTVLDFDKWMQSIDKRTQHVHRSLEARDAAAVADDAREIQTLYQSLSEYFANRSNAEDAVRLANEGRDLAASIVPSIERNDYDAAARAARGITTACSTCHEAYKPFK